MSGGKRFQEKEAPRDRDAERKRLRQRLKREWLSGEEGVMPHASKLRAGRAVKGKRRHWQTGSRESGIIIRTQCSQKTRKGKGNVQTSSRHKKELSGTKVVKIRENDPRDDAVNGCSSL